VTHFDFTGIESAGHVVHYAIMPKKKKVGVKKAKPKLDANQIAYQIVQKATK
jgi:hypothetical protein